MPLVLTDLAKKRVEKVVEWEGETVKLWVEPQAMSLARYWEIQGVIREMRAQTEDMAEGPEQDKRNSEITVEFLAAWIVDWDIYANDIDKANHKPVPINKQTIAQLPVALLGEMAQAVMGSTEVDEGEGEAQGESNSGARSSAPISMTRRKRSPKRAN